MSDEIANPTPSVEPVLEDTGSPVTEGVIETQDTPIPPRFPPPPLEGDLENITAPSSPLDMIDLTRENEFSNCPPPAWCTTD